jgi:hypothetical protein
VSGLQYGICLERWTTAHRIHFRAGLLKSRQHTVTARIICKWATAKVSIYLEKWIIVQYKPWEERTIAHYKAIEKAELRIQWWAEHWKKN